jgi:hypothetical protein
MRDSSVSVVVEGSLVENDFLGHFKYFAELGPERKEVYPVGKHST